MLSNLNHHSFTPLKAMMRFEVSYKGIKSRGHCNVKRVIVKCEYVVNVV